MIFSVLGQWIFDIFMGSLYTFCGYLIAEAFLVPKNIPNKKWHPVIIISIGVMQAVIARWNYTLFSDLHYIRFAINIITAILMYILVMLPFTGKFFMKFFVLAIICAVLVMSEILVVPILYITKQSTVFKDNMPMQLLCVLFQIALCLGIRFIRRGRRLDRMNSKVYKIRAVIPFISVITLSIINDNAIQDGIFSWSDIIIIISILFIDVVAYYVFETIERIYQQNQEYELQEQQHRLREEYYTQVEQHQKEIRTIKHDLNNQLTTLSGYISTGKFEKAIKEIRQIAGNLSESTELDFTEHPGLNALLRSKYILAQEQNILCEFEVNVPSDIGISDNDLAVVAGNILDNAIEACIHCEGRRYIKLKLIYYGTSLVLSCDNSTDGSYINKKTRKADRVNHGLGLESVKAVVDKYFGDMKFVSDRHSFHIELTMFFVC